MATLTTGNQASFNLGAADALTVTCAGPSDVANVLASSGFIGAPYQLGRVVGTKGKKFGPYGRAVTLIGACEAGSVEVVITGNAIPGPAASAPAATADQLGFYTKLAVWGDSLSAARNAPYVWTNFVRPNDGFELFDGGISGETSTQIKNRMLAATAQKDWTAIFWAGRNNFTDPTTIKADIAAMVAALTHTRYLVIGVTGADTSSAEYAPAGAQYLVRKQLNADLLALYGSKFLDLEAYLMTKGDNGTNDNLDVSRGLIPRSLRLDGTHPNAAGNALIEPYVIAALRANSFPTPDAGLTISAASKLMSGDKFLSGQPTVFTILDQGSTAGGGTTQNLGAQQLPTNFFDKDGRRIKIMISGTIANTAATKRFQPYFTDVSGSPSGTLADTGTFTSSAAGDFLMEFTAIRTSATSFRWIFTLRQAGVSLTSFVKTGELTGVTIINAMQFLILTSFTGTQADNDVVFKTLFAERF